MQSRYLPPVWLPSGQSGESFSTAAVHLETLSCIPHPMKSPTRKSGFDGIRRSVVSRVHTLLASGRILGACLGLISLLLAASSGEAAGITFNFTLSTGCTTSAGVYDANGQLIKTLWRKTSYAAGAQSALWDGTKDDGSAASNGTYQIKVLGHNVDYVWEGIIGNTDTSFTSVSTGGDTVWHGYDTMADMVSHGTNLFIANGYAEGNANAYRATTSAPNTPKQMVFNGNVADAAIQFKYVTTDGTWTYFAAGEGGYHNASCVLAYKVSDNTPATFTYGVSYKPMEWSATYPSVIDFTDAGPGNTSVNPPSGLAVQQAGAILAVAHAGANEVRLFHKTSGQALGSISITAPGRVAFHPTTNDLWVISGTSVKRFTAAQVAGVTTTGVVLTPAASLNGLNAPLAVGVDPRAGVDLVLVVDGGTSQQVKGFTSAGATAAGWTSPLGVAGGYTAASGNVVTNTKFWFFPPAYVTIQSDGSFWVGDAGNERSLHFSSARAYLEQIAFLPGEYVIAVDANAPTRVIGQGWMEYQVDYSKPLLPGDPAASGGNNSWKLVRNWAPGVPSDYFTLAINAGINSVTTLGNGRTYGVIYYAQLKQWEVVELPATGLLRLTGIRFPDSTTFYANGDLRRPSTVSGGIQTIYTQKLTGFDASGNPQWGSETVLATMPAAAQTPYYRWKTAGPNGPQFPVTASNVVIMFDQSVSFLNPNVNTGMHLGGARVGGSSWLWQASPAVTSVNYGDPAQQTGTYCIGDNTIFGGNKVVSEGRNVIYGFHGEGWQGKQANQFMHFYDDGLFVGQFGVPNANMTALAKVAGNSWSSTVVNVNGVRYFYHNDESNHAGIHRWRLDGIGSITQLGGSGVFNGGDTSITLTTLPAVPAGPMAIPGNAQVALSWQAVPGATGYNVYRGTTSSGQGATPVFTGVTGTTQLDTGLVNGTKYYYKVTAVNAGGMGGYSDEVTARPSASAFLHEAESGTRTNGATLYNDTFASNGQGVGGLNGSAAPGITISGVNGGAGGVKTLLIRYACPSVSTKNLYVNGVKIIKLTFPSTGAFGGSAAAYGTISTSITLPAGTSNTVGIINDNYDPYGVNLDFFSVD